MAVLDLLGRRWALRAIWEQRDGPLAFRALQQRCGGVSSSVLNQRLAELREAGAVCVNDAMLNYAALELPMGGWKESGLGSRHGAGGIRKYCAQQTLLVKRLAPKRDIHMFPYKAKTTRLIGRVFKFLYGRGKRA